MEFFAKKTTVDFMGARRWTYFLTAALFIGSFIALWWNGLNLGLDFTGGTQVIVQYQQPANIPAIRDTLRANGFEKAVVQNYGRAEDVLINLVGGSETDQNALGHKVITYLPGASLQRVDFIGPQVGQELITKGSLAILISVIATMIYIALRFEYRFAVSAALALIHDPVLIIGVFALTHLEFNLISLAAVLTVLGYSLNDTIVVFDRVRENFRKMRKISPVDVMNLSINQTLSRTIMTSGLTLFVVVALLVFGGEMLRGFSVALFVGIVIGTYSSIYVAGTLALALGLSSRDLIPMTKKELDDRP